MNERHEDQEEQEETPKLRVKRDTPPGGEGDTKACPKCGADCPEDAVLCVQCGYDFRSGTVHKTATGMSHTLLVIIAVVVSVVIAAGAILILMNVFKKGDPQPIAAVSEDTPPAPPQPAHVGVPEEAVPERPEAVEPPVEVTEEPEPLEEPDALEEAVEEEIAEVVEQVEEEEIVDPEREMEEMRESLRLSLDDRVPPHLIGDTVVLRRMNGFVHRGELVAIRDGVALVVDGEIRERVPLQELDRDSRLLVDMEFRERLVESRLRAMLENRE